MQANAGLALHPLLQRRLKRGRARTRRGTLGLAAVVGENPAELLDRHRVAIEAARRRPAGRQQIELCFAHVKRAFGLGGTPATTLVRLATRIAAKVTAYTYGLFVNRTLGRPQGRVKELWA